MTLLTFDKQSNGRRVEVESYCYHRLMFHDDYVVLFFPIYYFLVKAMKVNNLPGPNMTDMTTRINS